MGQWLKWETIVTGLTLETSLTFATVTMESH